MDGVGECWGLGAGRRGVGPEFWRPLGRYPQRRVPTASTLLADVPMQDDVVDKFNKAKKDAENFGKDVGNGIKNVFG